MSAPLSACISWTDRIFVHPIADSLSLARESGRMQDPAELGLIGKLAIYSGELELKTVEL